MHVIWAHDLQSCLNNWSVIKRVKYSDSMLYEIMKFENCLKIWTGFFKFLERIKWTYSGCINLRMYQLEGLKWEGFKCYWIKKQISMTYSRSSFGKILKLLIRIGWMKIKGFYLLLNNETDGTLSCPSPQICKLINTKLKRETQKLSI